MDGFGDGQFGGAEAVRSVAGEVALAAVEGLVDLGGDVVVLDQGWLLQDCLLWLGERFGCFVDSVRLGCGFFGRLGI